MAEVIGYKKRKGEISVQKMQLSVTNLIPRFMYPAEESNKQEVFARLLAVFEKQNV